MLQRDLKQNRKNINNFAMHEILLLKKVDLKKFVIKIYNYIIIICNMIFLELFNLSTIIHSIIIKIRL